MRAVLSILVAAFALAAGIDADERLPLNSELELHVVGGRSLVLEARPRRGELYETLAARLCGDANRAVALAAANPGIDEAHFGDESLRVRVPLPLLSAEYRALVLRGLFPEDRHDGADWIHLAHRGRLPIVDEGLWQVAEWFTGNGANFSALMEPNRLSSPELREGQPVRIPARLLHDAFRVRRASPDGSLFYDRDGDGPYAGYRLREGEALYSSVVLRFTGRTRSDDVNEIASRLASRSAIGDPRDIPAGYLVKIPLDVLEPQYLPPEHPRRLAAEAEREELRLAAAQEAERPRSVARGLDGVVIVIDPGHGGVDLGTSHHGVWEHDYVYDVACRLKTRLETESRARVFMTIVDEETGCRPSRGDALVANRKGSVQTDPPFLSTASGDSVTSANLRWYLSNAIYRKALADGVDKNRVVFLSLHADARHPSLSGLMVYVPGAAYRTKTYGKSGARYARYAEVKQKTHIRFGKQTRLRSEAVSRELADRVVAGFRRQGLPVQSYQPVRNRIIRGKSRYVPAVLAANAIPTKVLVEMLNLRNRDDAQLISRAAERQRIADALVDALFRQFGETPPGLHGADQTSP